MMLIRGIGGNRKVGTSYLSRQESEGWETLEMDRKVKERFRKGRGWVGGERRQAIKTDKHNDKKISWCQNKPLYLLLCIAFIASKPKIQLFA